MPSCCEVLLTLCLLSVLAVPVCRGGHISLGHNSLVLDFFSSVLEWLVTFIYEIVIFAQLPVHKIWKHTLLDNSLLTCFSLPEAILNPPQCLFLNTSPSESVCFLLFSFFSWRHLASPHSSLFPDCNWAWTESKFGEKFRWPWPKGWIDFGRCSAVEPRTAAMNATCTVTRRRNEKVPTKELLPQCVYSSKSLRADQCPAQFDIFSNWKLLLFLNSTSISGWCEPMSLSV